MMLALGLSIALAWVVALTTMFVYTAHSQHSIEDKILKSVAIQILMAIPDGKGMKVQRSPGLQLRDDALPDAEPLTFQVWAGKHRLVASTPDAPKTPLRPDFIEGFTD